MQRLANLGNLALLLVAASIVAPAASAQTIKLGEINEYKQFPAFLEPYRKGMELAVDEINAAGGVLGRKLEIISRDDNGVPGDAVRAAEELLTRERVSLLMGTFASNVGLAVADLAKRRQVLFIAAEPLSDNFWGVKIPFPLPGPGAKVTVTGNYSTAFTRATSGTEADPIMGVLTYDEIQYLEETAELATLPGMRP